MDILKGFAQTITIILDDSYERVYSAKQGVEQVVLDFAYNQR